MFLLRLLLKNAFRHQLRTGLTLIGLVVAICAFGLLRTIVDAWYAGVEASSSTRLVTRSSISLTFQLPLNYAQRIRAVEGVRALSWANWFGGVYITERNFFPQFAIDPASYLALYPEYVIADADRLAFLRDRQGAVVGRGLASKFGWQVGDPIPLRGTIYPGTWTFTLRAIYDGADAKTDENQMFVHWAFINESLRQTARQRADAVGVYIVGIDEPNNAALISQRIDALFANSLAETLSETEKAFQLSFVSMSEAILVAIQAVSLIIIVIIMAVMANTMTMTARERLAEYATLKALGFPPGFVVGLLYGESLLIAGLGGVLGVAATLPLSAAFAQATGTLFPVFQLSALTMGLQLLAAAIVGLVAAAWPAWRMSRIDIVDGLRHVA
ncbi:MULTISPECIES: ABC transporter permease [Candidatus Accumulibacter]|uniref:Acidobacterial duplicated orphan permease n=1 Tax=Candidatus Accumulibacter cognatus TaxID=2954383 RepID=A0A080M365_9PROT|nr:MULTISPECIES: ABC transporter permease [Candidatus Accumulibacter]MCC2868410.1 ABC transporter permease [Candidatus Accumulibacter phosphatis]KFB74790.1 MAG: acidobacterial duplicated orphan permease [Candidatus Accumulibacter cognatus]MBN8518587.1 ABC transporter permease [Accumulibacter sp.]MCM8622812.1 ABC transporter permease [Accumulibacter sp.]HMW57410.1 ABC transporter permease [Accumulibacter sp.]